MSDPRFRSRVTRLLRGELRVDDLKTLFLYARDRCDGSEAVREIGDFIAHHDERKKGIVTRSTRDWFTTVRFMAPRFMPGAPQLDELSLPSETPAYLKAAFRRQTNASFKERSGMSLTAGRHALEGLVRRFEYNLDGTLRLTRFIMPHEKVLLNVLTSSLNVVYAFSADDLFSDFQSTLIKNKILAKSETSLFAAIREPVILLAVAVMHNNDVIMEDKTKIRLSAQLSARENLIQVFADVPTGIQSPKPVSMSAPIFGGIISVNERLTIDLLRRQKWECELELGDDGRLHALDLY